MCERVHIGAIDDADQYFADTALVIWHDAVRQRLRSEVLACDPASGALAAGRQIGVEIGAGFASEKYVAFTQKEYALGVSAPLGAVTVGLNWVSAKSAGTTESGWEAVANYAMSKRTSVQVAYMSEDANAANRITTFRTRLLHKF